MPKEKYNNPINYKAKRYVLDWFAQNVISKDPVRNREFDFTKGNLSTLSKGLNELSIQYYPILYNLITLKGVERDRYLDELMADQPQFRGSIRYDAEKHNLYGDIQTGNKERPFVSSALFVKEDGKEKFDPRILNRFVTNLIENCIPVEDPEKAHTLYLMSLYGRPSWKTDFYEWAEYNTDKLNHGTYSDRSKESFQDDLEKYVEEWSQLDGIDDHRLELFEKFITDYVMKRALNGQSVENFIVDRMKAEGVDILSTEEYATWHEQFDQEFKAGTALNDNGMPILTVMGAEAFVSKKRYERKELLEEGAKKFLLSQLDIPEEVVDNEEDIDAEFLAQFFLDLDYEGKTEIVNLPDFIRVLKEATDIAIHPDKVKDAVRFALKTEAEKDIDFGNAIDDQEMIAKAEQTKAFLEEIEIVDLPITSKPWVRTKERQALFAEVRQDESIFSRYLQTVEATDSDLHEYLVAFSKKATDQNYQIRINALRTEDVLAKIDDLKGKLSRAQSASKRDKQVKVLEKEIKNDIKKAKKEQKTLQKQRKKLFSSVLKSHDDMAKKDLRYPEIMTARRAQLLKMQRGENATFQELIDIIRPQPMQMNRAKQQLDLRDHLDGSVLTAKAVKLDNGLKKQQIEKDIITDK